MRPILAALLACGLLAGCSGDDRPSGGRAVPSYRAEEAEAPEEPTARRGPPDGGVPSPSVGPVATAPPPADAGSERDLGAELRAMMGDVTSCMRWTRQAPARIDVTVTVTVSTTGVVTRTAASGGGLDASALACLRSRAGALRFSGPVPGAPVTASARFEVLSRPPAAPPPSEEEPRLRPGVALVPVVPGVPIQGPAGEPIAGPPGEPIEARPGEPIEGPPGQPIDAHPGLLPIGQGY